jgi:hypothetical protein
MEVEHNAVPAYESGVLAHRARLVTGTNRLAELAIHFTDPGTTRGAYVSNPVATSIVRILATSLPGSNLGCCNQATGHRKQNPLAGHFAQLTIRLQPWRAKTNYIDL